MSKTETTRQNVGTENEFLDCWISDLQGDSPEEVFSWIKRFTERVQERTDEGGGVLVRIADFSMNVIAQRPREFDDEEFEQHVKGAMEDTDKQLDRIAEIKRKQQEEKSSQSLDR